MAVDDENFSSELAHLGSLNGYVSELRQLHEKKVASVKKQSMGTLVDAFAKSVCYAGSCNNTDGPEDSSRLWLSFSFTSQSDEESTKRRTQALKVLVKERN